MTEEYGFGQAQAFICWTDTFTRSESFGLGSDYTWQDWDSDFSAAEDSTYLVDGSKVVNSDKENGDSDSYSLNNPVPLTGTVQFDFTTAEEFDSAYIVIVFGENYSFERQAFGIYLSSSASYLTAWWNAQPSVEDLEVILNPETTYTVKFSYTETGNFAGKIWETGDIEPDWMLLGSYIEEPFVSDSFAWLDLDFGYTFEDVDYGISSFDNLQFCAPEEFTVVTEHYGLAQAAALIHRYEGYAQAQGQITNLTANGHAQAYILWEPTTAPFRDTFTRTVITGLGTPRYLWTPIGSNQDHPAESPISVDGSKIVMPPGAVDSFYLGYTFGYHNYFEVEIPSYVPDEPFSFDFIIPGTQEMRIQIYQGSTNGIITLLAFLDEVFQSGITGVGSGTFKFAVRWHPNLLRIEIYKNGVFQGSSSGAVPMPNNFGEQNMLIKFTGAATETYHFDNLYLDTGTHSFAQARAKIKSIGLNRHGQARARIKGIPKQFAQAQAIINQAMAAGQAQAIIDQVFTVGYAQAQASISIQFKKFAQAQARVKQTRWNWAQAQAYIKHGYVFSQAQAYIVVFGLTRSGQTQALIVNSTKSGQAQALIISTINYGYSQARAKISGVAPGRFAQAQALIRTFNWIRSGQAKAIIVGATTHSAQAQASIKRTISQGQAQGYIAREDAGKLVKFNGYYLPGYLQEESLPSEMTIEAHVAQLDGSLSEYIGLTNKFVSIRMKVVEPTYAQIKNKILEAGTLLRSNRSGFTPLFINNSRYYLALTKGISSEATAGTEKTVDYTAEFECKPWLYGTETHTLTGNTLLDTDTIGRDYLDGTWTPTRLTITGTNVTVSGYTDTSFAGFISVSGAVSNLQIDTEYFDVRLGGTKRNELINNYDYSMYVGPGRTRFAITGADVVTIEYEDRWNL